MVLWTAVLWGRPAGAITQPPHDEALHGIVCSDCHVPYAGVNDPAVSSGTADAGFGAISLTDTTKSWTPSEWVDGVVTFLSGANEGEFRTIESNTENTITWALPLPASLAVGDGYRIGKTTYEDIETRCKSCHNPTGSASSMPNVGLHVVRGGTVVGCGKCHDPHNVDPNSGQGQDLIRVDVRWPTANNPTQYPAASNPFITGTPSFQGICETCHTMTAYHRNRAEGDHSHNAATPCTSCHRHEKGFQGGDCVSCHGTAQDNGDGVPVGGRRAVVGEFPLGDAHAHYGAELDNASCAICHSQSTHMDGYVDLIDPDDENTTYRFVSWADLADDPDVSNFCMGCHDEDGASRLTTPFDPFGNGNVPPDVAERFKGTLQWEEQYGDACFGTEGTGRRVNAHHDVSSADQTWSSAKVECLNCHGAHAASGSQPIADPFNPTTPWAGTLNEFCLSCHDGGNGPTDPDFPPGVTGPSVALRGLDTCAYKGVPWYVDYTWTFSAHGPDSKRGWDGYSGAPAHDLDCTVCHDAHGSYTASNPSGNPYMIRDQVNGTPFEDDGTRTGGFFGPPWDTFGTMRDVVVTVSGQNVGWGASNGLCSTCHAGWESAYSWHSYCDACQTCHGHGQAWGNGDLGPSPDDSTPCP